MSQPTGEAFRLETTTASGPLEATVVSVAAALQSLCIDGVDLVPGFEGITPAGHGIVMVPWPSRVRDGRWLQDGVVHALAITEPALNNAIHGLLRFTGYRATERERDAVTLAASVYPQEGYPFLLDTTVRYELMSDGLLVTHSVLNAGAEAAPVALGTHPYLKIGGVNTADLTVRVSGASRVELDDRLLPGAEVPVDDATDLRSGRRVGDVSLNDCYGELEADDDGIVSHTLTAPDGRSLALWAEDDFAYVVLFTTDRIPGEPLAIAIEPQTAPPDAFNSGKSLRWLEPGEEWRLRWGIRFRGFEAR